LTFSVKRTKIVNRRLHWLRKIKTSKGCEVCGYNESPLALDFAHINPIEKHSQLGPGGPKYAGMDRLYRRICIVDMKKNTKYIKELFDEIRKCKILCKNCHVIETFKNNEFYGVELNKNRGGYYDKGRRNLPMKKQSDLQEFFVD
jgi:hypothetical protein